MARVLADTIEGVVGDRPAFTMCPGILETRWYARKGIPAFAYGPGLLEVSHGPREAIEIERIYQHTLLYALVAARLLSLTGKPTLLFRHVPALSGRSVSVLWGWDQRLELRTTNGVGVTPSLGLWYEILL